MCSYHFSSVSVAEWLKETQFIIGFDIRDRESNTGFKDQNQELYADYYGRVTISKKGLYF